MSFSFPKFYKVLCVSHFDWKAIQFRPSTKKLSLSSDCQIIFIEFFCPPTIGRLCPMRVFHVKLNVHSVLPFISSAHRCASVY